MERRGNGFKDIKGQWFGRLTVIRVVGKNSDRKAMWECSCSCGGSVITSGKSLRGGTILSCGCLQRERAAAYHLTHGDSKKGQHKRLYQIWISMKGRILNPRNKNYHNYGGRGIDLCEEWLDFAVFKEWALENGYAQGLSIDRTDNNKGYHPWNCKWITMREQARNRRNCVVYNGETATEASRRLGGNNLLVAVRIRDYGWTKERAFTTPVIKHHANK